MFVTWIIKIVGKNEEICWDEDFAKKLKRLHNIVNSSKLIN